jgi:hypothetical protein
MHTCLSCVGGQLVRAIRDGEKLRRHLKKEKKDANPTQARATCSPSLASSLIGRPFGCGLTWQSVVVQEEAPQKMLPIIVVTDKTSPDGTPTHTAIPHSLEEH